MEEVATGAAHVPAVCVCFHMVIRAGFTLHLGSPCGGSGSRRLFDWRSCNATCVSRLDSPDVPSGELDSREPHHARYFSSLDCQG